MLLFLFTTLSLAGAATPAAPAEAVEQAAPSYPLDPVLGVLRDDRLFDHAQVGIQVVNLRTGEEVFAYKPDELLLPASVMKTVTSAAALKTLGPAWTFSTDAYYTGEIDENGVLDGDLYIKGTGDPTIVVEKLWKLVHDIQINGLLEVHGDIYFDDSYFDDEHLIEGWRKDVDLANGPAYFAPLGALSVNYNTISLVVAPAHDAGKPARVGTEFVNPLVTIEGEVKTGAVGSRSWLSIDRELDDTGKLVTFKVKGSVPVDADIERYYRAVGDPMAHFQAIFAAVAKERGLVIKGKWKEGKVPNDAEWVAHMESPPLAEILAHMNKQSSNFMAEHVLKAMGAEVYGAPGTTANGLKVVEKYLAGIGVEPGSYSLVNGSGLARTQKLAPSQVTAVLLDMSHDQIVGPEFVTSLSVGGVDGTLRKRFDEPEQVGRVRGKTGSVNGVYCLAAYVLGGDGDTYAFAFFVNGIEGSTWPTKKLQGELGRLLMELTDQSMASSGNSGSASAASGAGTGAP